MGVLIDTNVLLRMAQPDHSKNSVALASVAKILRNGEPAYLTLQNVAEFWNVATRPLENNGMGLSIDFVIKEIESLEKELTLLVDNASTYYEWKRLVANHQVIGSKVHDARLVAAMTVYGVKRILTFNTSDFERYDVEALHPESLCS